MTAPLVSVVVEAVTAREEGSGALADELAGTMAALDRQAWPATSIERIVVVPEETDDDDKAEIARRYAPVRLEVSPNNYFAAKNAGARVAAGAFVAFLDGDCVPADDWLSALMAGLDDKVAAVTGRTRYEPKGRAERILSVPIFATVLESGDGEASGLMLNNVLFRREVLIACPLDPRIPRYGGCVLLRHQLRAGGHRIVYQPAAKVAHGSDLAGTGLLRKHWGRGHDMVTMYGIDETNALNGTRLFRRFGRPILIAFSARRIVRDLGRLLRHRRQMGIGAVSIPFYWMLGAGLRLVELAGALTAPSVARSDAGPATANRPLPVRAGPAG